MAFALVASVSATPGANGGATAAVDSTGANLLVVSVSYYSGGGAVPAVSDSKGNTWTALTARAPGATGHRFFYVAAPTVGTGHTVTVSATACYPVITAYAFAGAAASPFDGETGATTSSAGPLATGSVTPTGPGALIISGWAGMNGTSNPAVTAGVSLTTSQNPSAGTNVAGAAGYRLQATAAAINPSWSWTGTDPVAVAVVAFLPASATGLMRVQAAPTAQASTAALAIAFTGAPTVGNAIVVLVNCYAHVPLSASDNHGNPYTLVTTRQAAANQPAVGQFVCSTVGTTGLPFTITVVLADTADVMATALEVGGVGAGLAVDQFASATGSSAAPASGSTAALTASDVLLVGHFAGAGAFFSIAVASATPPWVQEFEDAFGLAGEADSRIVSSATGTTPSISWTCGGSANWAALIVAYTIGAAEGLRGSAVFGVETTVTATRAVAFGLDGETNIHDDAGTLKVFGDVAVTGETTLDGTIAERGRTTPMGGWESYTPTWTNVTVGNGTVTAKCSTVGTTVNFAVLLTFGSTTAITGNAAVSTPSAFTAVAGAVSHGRVMTRDVSAAIYYAGLSVTVSSGVIGLYVQNPNPSSVGMVPITATAPFTWATGDQLFLGGTYDEG